MLAKILSTSLCILISPLLYAGHRIVLVQTASHPSLDKARKGFEEAVERLEGVEDRDSDEQT